VPCFYRLVSDFLSQKSGFDLRHVHWIFGGKSGNETGFLLPVLRNFDRGTRRVWVVSSIPRPHFTPGKDPVPILQEADWAPGPVWTGGKSPPTGIGSRTVQRVVSRYTDWDTRPPPHTHTHKHTHTKRKKEIFLIIWIWTFAMFCPQDSH